MAANVRRRHGRGAGTSLKATLGVWLFLAPCLVAFLAVPVAAAPASEACGSDLQEAEWNKTVDRAALVPWNVFMPYNDVYYEAVSYTHLTLPTIE